MRDPTLALAAQLNDRVFAGEAADRALDHLLRGNRWLDNEGRARVARRGLGAIVLAARLDFLLLGALTAPSEGPRAGSAERIGAWLVSEEGLSTDLAETAMGLAPGTLGALREPVRWPDEPTERLAAARSLPRWLARMLVVEWGPEADPLAETFNRPGPVSLRANRLKNGRGELLERLAREGVEARPSRFAPDGVELSRRANLFGLDAWREGRFEVQDEGSQLVAAMCAARPGERALDLCAGAGGKTLALAAAMRNEGRIDAFDIDRRRLAAHKARSERAGVTIASIRPIGDDPAVGAARRCGDAFIGAVASATSDASIGDDLLLPESARDYDLALVDAPCSSLGTLRRSPDARWKLREADLCALPPLQLRLLLTAADRLRPGGRLVYATCTLSRAENEAVVAAFRAQRSDFAPLPPAALLGTALADRLGADTESLALAPHRHGCDGFFAAALAAPLQ